MPILDCIEQNNIYIKRNQCEDEDCELFIDTDKEHVILKPDIIQETNPMCDNIVFIDDGPIIIVVVELKSRNPDIDHAIKQIENGTRKSLEILSECNENGVGFFIIPILLYKAISYSGLKILGKKEIQINGESYEINHDECGSSLSNFYA